MVYDTGKEGRGLGLSANQWERRDVGGALLPRAHSTSLAISRCFHSEREAVSKHKIAD
jgi:hypothetical protein